MLTSKQQNSGKARVIESIAPKSCSSSPFNSIMEAIKPPRDFSLDRSFSKATDIVGTNEAAWDQCGLRINDQHGCLEDTDNVCGEFLCHLERFISQFPITFKNNISIY